MATTYEGMTDDEIRAELLRKFGQAPVDAAEARRGTPANLAKGAMVKSPTATLNRRANQYGAKCVKCNVWVEAEQGYLAKTSTGKWAAEHPTCPEATVAAPTDSPSRTAPAAPVTPGMYRKADGTMYRAYPGRESGRVLAKRLVGDLKNGYGFEYAGLASRFVTAGERMTLEEVKEWGAVYGTCCMCAALLTDPDSVKAGIGPVCSGKV